jgi:hypothetical protein
MRNLALLLLVLSLAACGGSNQNAAQPGSSAAGAPTSTGKIDPANFVATVDNPWFPLPSGAKWTYRGEKDGIASHEVVTVPGDTKTIQGVDCTVVHDVLYQQGNVAERTDDYYAQDTDGTVWYFGEDTAELNAKGEVTTREGTWHSGEDGASAGIFMTASPQVGESHRQEYLKGHAEDHYAVVALGQTVHVPGVSSDQALLTKEWTPLEPHVLDHKYYVQGLGTVLEQTVRGGSERNALVSFTKG